MNTRRNHLPVSHPYDKEESKAVEAPGSAGAQPLHPRGSGSSVRGAHAMTDLVRRVRRAIEFQLGQTENDCSRVAVRLDGDTSWLSLGRRGFIPQAGGAA